MNYAAVASSSATASHDSPAAFDPSDWAWEFLRRNPDYRTDWQASAPRRLAHVTLKDGTRLLRLRRRYPRAERWGLYAFTDPSVPARLAPVFWHLEALQRIVRVRAELPAEPDRPSRGTALLALSDFRVDRVAAIGVDNVHLVLMKGLGSHVPVEISGLAALSLPFAPVFEIGSLLDLGVQTELLKRLHRFAEHAPNSSSRSTFAIDERLHHALIALDESLAGKTFRQIAITIYGEKRVADDWQGPSQYLKDRMRRLVAKGTELMNGGYRDLLL